MIRPVQVRVEPETGVPASLPGSGAANRPDHIRRRQAGAKPNGPRPPAYAYFQYTGSTGLRVRAPNSGSRHRFNGADAIAAVDPKDRRALAAIRQ